MQTFQCAVVLVGDDGGRIGTGWAGLVRAESPAAAARVARGRHSPGSRCYAPGDRVSCVEVCETPGERKIGDF